MAQTEDFTRFSGDKKMALLNERIKVHFHMPDSESATYVKRLFDHYERLKIFPNNLSTLDVSMKALVKMWRGASQQQARP